VVEAVAIGVTKSLKTASEPLITPVPLSELAMVVMMGASDEDTVSSLAGRLARLDKQLDDKEHARIKQPRPYSSWRLPWPAVPASRHNWPRGYLSVMAIALS
jgi:hypothetical protein